MDGGGQASKEINTPSTLRFKQKESREYCFFKSDKLEKKILLLILIHYTYKY